MNDKESRRAAAIKAYKDRDFTRQDSPFLIRQAPDSRPGRLVFEVHRNGSLPAEATLVFELQPDGSVRAETNVSGADLPGGMAVEAVTAQWAEDVAEQVL